MWNVAVMALMLLQAPEQTPLPNPEILTRQFEAQERERAIARRIDWQIERAKAAETASQAKPAAKPAKRGKRRK